VTAPPLLVYGNQYQQQLGTNGQPNNLNLYLYSEPDAKADLGADHLGCFNELVQYQDSTGIYKSLDLEAVSDLCSASLDPPVAGMGLRKNDLESLVELKTGEIAHSGCQIEAKLVDPVECLQGWGT
jgi:hypothetical protein